MINQHFVSLISHLKLYNFFYHFHSIPYELPIPFHHSFIHTEHIHFTLPRDRIHMLTFFIYGSNALRLRLRLYAPSVTMWS